MSPRNLVVGRGRKRKKAHSYFVLHSPREAALEIVRLINSRNQNVALLALSVGVLSRPDFLGKRNLVGCGADKGWNPTVAPRYLRQKLRLPLSTADQHEGISE